jgi:hypothetical protein
MIVYKRTPTLQLEGMRYIPPSSRELLEHSAQPIVTLFFFNIIPVDVELLLPRRVLNHDRSLCASCLQDHLRIGNV